LVFLNAFISISANVSNQTPWDQAIIDQTSANGFICRPLQNINAVSTLDLCDLHRDDTSLGGRAEASAPRASQGLTPKERPKVAVFFTIDIQLFFLFCLGSYKFSQAFKFVSAVRKSSVLLSIFASSMATLYIPLNNTHQYLRNL
jgi:hypothetical protein